MADSMTTTDNSGMRDLIEIMLRRTGKLYISNGAEIPLPVTEDEQLSDAVLATFRANALAWNYIITQDVIDDIKEHVADESYLKLILDVMADSRYKSGVTKEDVTPMYPDFPKQVAEASDAELILNALMHYTGDALGIRITPEYKQEPRVSLGIDSKRVTPDTISETADQDDVRKVAEDLLLAPTAWSNQDKDDLAVLITWGFNTFGGGERVEPLIKEIEETSITQRENKAWVIAHPFDGNAAEISTAVEHTVDLPSDVMRIAVIWANEALDANASNKTIATPSLFTPGMTYRTIGATSTADLHHPAKFKLTRIQRRKIVALLAQALNVMSSDRKNVELTHDRISDQFARDEENWMKLSRAIHIHELLKKGQADPIVVRWFDILRHGDCRTLNSRVEDLMFRFTKSLTTTKTDGVKSTKTMMASDDDRLERLANGGLKLTTVDGKPTITVASDIMESSGLVGDYTIGVDGDGNQTESLGVLMELLDLLKSNPGMYARRLVELLRKTKTLVTGAELVLDGNQTESLGVLMELLDLLKSNPGMYARRLVELLRKTKTLVTGAELVLDGFSEIAPRVSTRVLVEIWNLMQVPAGCTDGAPKWKAVTLASGKTVSLPVTIMDDVTRDQALRIQGVIEESLEGRNKGLDWVLGVDPDTRYAMPLSTRFASGGKTAGRGTRVKLDGYNAEDPDLTIRMFVHWRDRGNTVDDRVDLDLSTVVASDDLESCESVWYGDLRNSSMTHSGDLTSAPNGACEYIDVNVGNTLERGWRYVIPTVHSYTGQTFDTIPEAFAGVMFRHGDAQKGEIFDATTVKSRFDLDKQATNTVPFVFDLKTGELIWLDSTVKSSTWRSVGDSWNVSALLGVVDSLVHSNPMSVVDLKTGELIWLDSTVKSSTWRSVGDSWNVSALLGVVDSLVHSNPMSVAKLASITGALIGVEGEVGFGSDEFDDLVDLLVNESESDTPCPDDVIVHPWQSEVIAKLLD